MQDVALVGVCFVLGIASIVSVGVVVFLAIAFAKSINESLEETESPRWQAVAMFDDRGCRGYRVKWTGPERFGFYEFGRDWSLPDEESIDKCRKAAEFKAAALNAVDSIPQIPTAAGFDNWQFP